MKSNRALGVMAHFTVDAAKEALTDMPPRSEEELDHVTLHNQVSVCVCGQCLLFQCKDQSIHVLPFSLILMKRL
jgi:hypothetical protein